MKLFGEYLIEKNIVTEDQLVDALVDQIREEPSICEITYSEKLLTTSQILSILSLQTKEKLTFIDSAKKLKAWNPDIEKKISEILQKKRIPIGQILLKKGGANFDQLINALDEFLAEIKPHQEDEKPAPSIKTSSKQPETTSTLDPSVLEIFSDSVNEEDYQNTIDSIENISKQLQNEQTPQEINTELDSLHSYLHKFKGNARFLKIKEIEDLAHQGEILIEVVKKNKVSLKSKHFAAFAKVSLNTVKILWTIKEMLLKLDLKQSLWDDEEFKKEYQELLTELEVLNFDFSNL